MKANFQKREKPSFLTLKMHSITESVCNTLQVSAGALFTENKAFPIVEARMICTVVLYEHMGLSHKSIAHFFNRERTMTNYYLRRFRALSIADKGSLIAKYRRCVEALKDTPLQYLFTH